jgi:hypothetical protein
VFFGPLGFQSCNLIDYLQSIPGTPRFSEGDNPATWMLGEAERDDEDDDGEDGD